MADRDKETGRFLPGNRFWEARSSHGAKPKFDDPQDLWDACCEYFEWADSNPLHEAKAFAYEGSVTVEALPKMRAMTIRAMCVFLDIGHSTWNSWKDTRPDLLAVITRVEDIIYSQKFEGASAGLLVPNIIARDLGLADKQELTANVKVKDEDDSFGRVAGALERAAGAIASCATRTSRVAGEGET